MPRTINTISQLRGLIRRYENSYDKKRHKESTFESMDNLLIDEEFKDESIVEDVIDFYQLVLECNEMTRAIEKTNIIDKLQYWIDEKSKQCYGDLRVDWENYKLKTLLYYENNMGEEVIAYMAGSFHTDQDYRAFLSTIQKGKKRIQFTPVDVANSYRLYSLTTVKDGYLSRVKRTLNDNTRDGYHADFHLDNGRFFLLRENDNPIEVVYNWIVKNTQAGVLPEWKTYLYNALSESGYITNCEVVNYSNIGLKGFVLSDDVNTELIRELRTEGMSIGEISIPREPVVLEEGMSFIEAMEQFIIPEITERKVLYTVGDEMSPVIESPIIFRKGNKIKKSSLYPRQKVMTQGMLNGIKEGRNSIIINGGMGVGKTYISIKLAYAAITEVFKKKSGRVSIYCQSHILGKWQRQFSEALPDVPLKFFQINSYSDVLALEDKAPEGIEVYLLPKDRVKRKYLEGHSGKKKYSTSSSLYYYNKELEEKEYQPIYIADSIRRSEMRVLARKLSKSFDKWVCVAKTILNDDGEIGGYKVATTSDILKEKYGKRNDYYDFFIKDLDEILLLKESLDKNDEEKSYYTGRYIQRGLVCPDCGGPIYEKEDDQLSEDEYKNNLFIHPKSKSDRNSKCTNYIKGDGTPLTTKERNLIIKGELSYTMDETLNVAYLNEDDSPINDIELLQEIKQGKCESYKVVLKKCNSPLWTAIDQKGYRTANAIDMIVKRFGKNFFDCSIADEAHLYAATSNQGESFSKLCKISKVNLALTGTLTGGKASHLFYMLYRMIPHKMSKYFKYNELTKFIDHYGRRKKVTKEYGGNSTYNKSGVGRTSTSYSEIPGISPLLYSHFLADIVVSRKLEDMGFNLPPLLYYKHEVKMSDKLQRGYNKLKDDIINFMKENKHLNLGGTYLNALLAYPDMPITEPLMYEGEIISTPDIIDIENIILPKEQKLIDTLKRELAQGRRMVVYITYTGEKAVDKRVEKVLKAQGFKVALLKSSVNTEKREKWIEDRYQEGIQVIITNPKIVQTGLDIIQYPSYYFFQLDYDVRVVRQAESRGWRVGQDKNCHVFYGYYKDTIQEDALRLIGSKKKASLAIEGVMAEDILSASGDEVLDSGVTALYKSLLGKIKLKETDLDFFSEEEIIDIIDDVVDEITKTTTTTIKKTETGELQISFFTVTEESLMGIKQKDKKNVAVGQISLFGF